MNNLLTNEEMAALNYAVEAKALDERLVAEDFLRLKGLIK
jgi:glycine betaine/choline ABC-type transport system substrate-binding protein